MTDYGDWYEPATGELEQGDILTDFPVLLPTLNPETNEIAMLRKSTNVVILTQSCDIAKPAQQTLLLVQAVDYEEASSQKNGQHLKSEEYRKALAGGTAISDFLLPPAPSGQVGYTLVHFRNLFVLPKPYILSQRSEDATLRIRSPYKEHFAQAYARFMMRVGLPKTLHDFLK